MPSLSIRFSRNIVKGGVLRSPLNGSLSLRLPAISSQWIFSASNRDGSQIEKIHAASSGKSMVVYGSSANSKINKTASIRDSKINPIHLGRVFPRVSTVYANFFFSTPFDIEAGDFNYLSFDGTLSIVNEQKIINMTFDDSYSEEIVISHSEVSKLPIAVQYELNAK